MSERRVAHIVGEACSGYDGSEVVDVGGNRISVFLLKEFRDTVADGASHTAHFQ